MKKNIKEEHYLLIKKTKKKKNMKYMKLKEYDIIFLFFHILILNQH